MAFLFLVANSLGINCGDSLKLLNKELLQKEQKQRTEEGAEKGLLISTWESCLVLRKVARM